MVDKVQTTQGVVFPGGLTVTETQEISIEAYDKIDAVLKANTSQQSTPIQVQPGGSGQVKFLLIKSDKYSELVNYSVGVAESNADKRIKLDWIQLFQGSGMLELLPEPPQTLHFYNGTDKDVTIQVLVGRTAIAPSATSRSSPGSSTPTSTSTSRSSSEGP